MSTPSGSTRSLGRQIAGPLAQFWHDGAGPTRPSLDSAFSTAGLEPEDVVGSSKQARVGNALAQVDDEAARTLITDLVDLLQVDGAFESENPLAERRFKKLQEAFELVGATLSSSGSLTWGLSGTSAPRTSRDGTTSSREVPMTSTSPTIPPRGRTVFVVHGRDHQAKGELVVLLKAFDLFIVDWTEASIKTRLSAPTTAQVIDSGMKGASAIVVLFTPDDLGQCKEDFLGTGDAAHESSPTGQARLNVIFEAGMAWAKYRDRTVLVEIGRTRPMSDLDGVQMLRLDGTLDSRRTLRARLHNAGLAVADGDLGWTTAGNFG